MVQKSKQKPKDHPIRDVGRPSKFTKERVHDILESIYNRIPYEIAAEANGICEETLYDWINTGKVDERNGVESDYAKFSKAIKQAEQVRIREHLNEIAAKPDRWQADAWILERRWNRHFSSNAHLMELQKRLDKLEAMEALPLTEDDSDAD